jgi:hypothetical protein
MNGRQNSSDLICPLKTNKLMKLHLYIAAFTIFISAPKLFGQATSHSTTPREREAISWSAANSSQPTSTEHLYIPGLAPASQSNVIISISDFFGQGQICPMKYTNALANTNLFSAEEQRTIAETFVKYKSVTTNSGPPGTHLVKLYRTNYVTNIMGRNVVAENWVAYFQHTNSNSREELTFGAGLLVKFRTNTNDGYNIYIGRSGNGSIFQFMYVEGDMNNGVFATFDDNHPQGINWDFRLPDFAYSHLYEYRRYTNGMVIGKFLMWNPRNGNLIIEAEFKDPYEWDKHRIPIDLQ